LYAHFRHAAPRCRAFLLEPRYRYGAVCCATCATHGVTCSLPRLHIMPHSTTPRGPRPCRAALLPGLPLPSFAHPATYPRLPCLPCHIPWFVIVRHHCATASLPAAYREPYLLVTALVYITRLPWHFLCHHGTWFEDIYHHLSPTRRAWRSACAHLFNSCVFTGTLFQTALCRCTRTCGPEDIYSTCRRRRLHGRYNAPTRHDTTYSTTQPPPRLPPHNRHRLRKHHAVTFHLPTPPHAWLPRAAAEDAVDTRWLPSAAHLPNSTAVPDIPPPAGPRVLPPLAI